MKHTSEEIKYRLSDLGVQIGNIAIEYITELEKENAELRKIAEFQQSSNMGTHLENKKLKEGLAVGSMWNNGLNSLNKALEEERDKYRNMVFDKDEQLTKAKELLEKFCSYYMYDCDETIKDYKSFEELKKQAEQFLKEN